MALAGFVGTVLLSGKTGGPVQVVKASADVVARGKYLAEAADCAACHSAPGGAPYAGGLAMASGFGTIYATNITPDPDNGIGRWTSDDFWRALHNGMRRDGQPLYPAMPYTSYRGMTRADSDAIYAWLMQLRPMPVANRQTALDFPYNIRLGMAGWNTLFLTDSLPATSEGSSAAWQRGRYLVDVLGHCGECHTPRGPLGEMELSRSLTGSRAGPRRRTRHHAGRTRRARLDAGEPRHLSQPRHRRPRVGLRRHASGRGAQHAQPERPTTSSR